MIPLHQEDAHLFNGTLLSHTQQIRNELQNHYRVAQLEDVRIIKDRQTSKERSSS